MTDYVLVLYYSRNGSVANLAQQVARGIESTAMEARLRTVPAVSANCEASEPAIPIRVRPTPHWMIWPVARAWLWAPHPLWQHGRAAEIFHRPDQRAVDERHPDRQTCRRLQCHRQPARPGKHAAFHDDAPAPPRYGAGRCPYSEAALLDTQSGGTPYGPTHVSGSQGDPALTEHEITLARALGKRLALLARQLKAS